MLETIEVETAPQPNAAIIWLHGLGADGHDFEPIVPELVQRGSRAWRFVFPNAPMRPVTINGGMRMRAWYDIAGLDRKAAEDSAGYKDSDAKVRELIAREVGRGIPTHRIVLAGFSQGGVISLYTAPRLEEKLAGVMALSCYMPRESTFEAERAPANDGTPIFMAHGQFDGTLPMMLGVKSRDYLQAHGYAIEWHEYPMAHAVSAEEVVDIRQFLLRVLP
ncbi:MAG TPA: alpha/beta fold hydrolase [Steroidobacteraceae bacterium]|jgi:phospholipase/carboxylesterase|nr:alpha/beta fold hydrolase [Steroidobacteraceae bacterium]